MPISDQRTAPNTSRAPGGDHPEGSGAPRPAAQRPAATSPQPADAGNPWQQLDHQRIDEYAGNQDEARAEHAMTDRSYRGTEQDVKPCHAGGCIGTMHYRDTVGALQCSACGALAHMNGQPITTNHSASPATGFPRRSIDEQVRQSCEARGLAFTIGRGAGGAQRYIINGESLSPGDAADRYLPGGFAGNFRTAGVPVTDHLSGDREPGIDLEP